MKTPHIYGHIYLDNALLYSAFVLSVAATLASGCHSSKAAEQTSTSNTSRPISAWQRQPLTIDGSDSDWVRPLPYYVTEEKLAYAISNDGVNLYIQWATRDPQEQQKILQGGLTVWINKDGERASETAVGVGYPLDLSNNRERQLMVQAQPDKYRDKPIALEDQKDYSLYGFGENPETYEYGQSNPEGVEVKTEYNGTGEMIYEASVPLKALFPKTSPRYYSGHNIAVGFFVEGIPPQAGGRRGGGGPAIGVGGGLGFGGFGSGAGLGLSIGTGLGRSAARKDPSTKPGKIWQVVTIARQPG